MAPPEKEEAAIEQTMAASEKYKQAKPSYHNERRVESAIAAADHRAYGRYLLAVFDLGLADIGLVVRGVARDITRGEAIL